MIQIGDTTLDLSAPLDLAGLAAAGALLLIMLMLDMELRAAARSARAAAPLAQQLGHLGQPVQGLAQGQEGLRASVQMVSDTATNGQAQLAQTVEQRLAAVQQQMQDRLAEMILAGDIADGDSVPVSAGVDGLIVGDRISSSSRTPPEDTVVH